MKISRDTREIIKIAVFLLVLGVLLTVYGFYPLSHTRTYHARPDIDSFNQDTLCPNEDSLWTTAGMIPDTFRVEADGWVTIAGLRLEPSTDSAAGTVFLLHDDGGTRDDMRLLAQSFLDSGFVVVAYDQRASGRSTGKYRGEGQREAADLVAVLSHLELRGLIVHPVSVIGHGVGGDAALLAALEDSRIDRVAAIDPHLGTSRFLDRARLRHDGYWFPFYRTVMWFWYNIRSSYGEPYRDIDLIDAVACPTLLLLPEDALRSKELEALRTLSDPELLTVEPLSADGAAVFRAVVGARTE